MVSRLAHTSDKNVNKAPEGKIEITIIISADCRGRKGERLLFIYQRISKGIKCGNIISAFSLPGIKTIRIRLPSSYRDKLLYGKELLLTSLKFLTIVQTRFLLKLLGSIQMYRGNKFQTDFLLMK